jgi:hypothetical protein
MKKILKSTLSLRKEVVVILNQNQLKTVFGGDPALEATGPNTDTLSLEPAPTLTCTDETLATTRNSKTGQYSESIESC